MWRDDMDARENALKALIEISNNTNFEYDRIFNTYSQKSSYKADFGMLMHGVIRHISYLDFLIEQIYSKKAKFLQVEARNILRLGLFEINFNNTPDYAVVNSYVELAKKYNPRAVSLINAVLRNFLRKKDDIALPKDFLERLSVEYSHPKWMIKRWMGNYGEDEIESILNFNNTPYGLWVRVNTLKISVEEFLDILNQADIEFVQNEILPECIKINYKGEITNLVGYEEGYWAVQGLSSSLVAKVLAPDENDFVLDICAAPGAKTAHIASLMKNTGRILAVDKSAKRLEKVAQNINRLGLNSVETLAKDAINYDFGEFFDKILVDAPCSNTGIFSKKPDAKWNKTISDIESLAKIQLEILENAANYLKPNGFMVYSTCSIEVEENILVVNKFLSKHSNFQLEPFSIPYQTNGTLQILPHEFGMEGFFIAKFKRINTPYMVDISE